MDECGTSKPEFDAPGKLVVIDNQSKKPVEVGTGLVFRENGDYIVSVRDGRITIKRFERGCEEGNDT